MYYLIKNVSGHGLMWYLCRICTKLTLHLKNINVMYIRRQIVKMLKEPRFYPSIEASYPYTLYSKSLQLCYIYIYIYILVTKMPIYIYLFTIIRLILDLFKDDVLTSWTRIWYDILLFSMLIIYRKPHISHFVSSNLKMTKIHIDDVSLRHTLCGLPINWVQLH